MRIQAPEALELFAASAWVTIDCSRSAHAVKDPITLFFKVTNSFPFNILITDGKLVWLDQLDEARFKRAFRNPNPANEYTQTDDFDWSAQSPQTVLSQLVDLFAPENTRQRRKLQGTCLGALDDLSINTFKLTYNNCFQLELSLPTIDAETAREIVWTQLTMPLIGVCSALTTLPAIPKSALESSDFTDNIDTSARAYHDDANRPLVYLQKAEIMNGMRRWTLGSNGKRPSTSTAPSPAPSRLGDIVRTGKVQGEKIAWETQGSQPIDALLQSGRNKKHTAADSSTSEEEMPLSAQPTAKKRPTPQVQSDSESEPSTYKKFKSPKKKAGGGGIKRSKPVNFEKEEESEPEPEKPKAPKLVRKPAKPKDPESTEEEPDSDADLSEGAKAKKEDERKAREAKLTAMLAKSSVPTKSSRAGKKKAGF